MRNRNRNWQPLFNDKTIKYGEHCMEIVERYKEINQIEANLVQLIYQKEQNGLSSTQIYQETNIKCGIEYIYLNFRKICELLVIGLGIMNNSENRVYEEIAKAREEEHNIPREAWKADVLLKCIKNANPHFNWIFPADTSNREYIINSHGEESLLFPDAYEKESPFTKTQFKKLYDYTNKILHVNNPVFLSPDLNKYKNYFDKISKWKQHIFNVYYKGHRFSLNETNNPIYLAHYADDGKFHVYTCPLIPEKTKSYIHVFRNHLTNEYKLIHSKIHLGIRKIEELANIEYHSDHNFYLLNEYTSDKIFDILQENRNISIKNRNDGNNLLNIDFIIKDIKILYNEIYQKYDVIDV